MGWQDQGRQRHGFFGHGTAPEQGSSTSGHDHPMFAPGNYGLRIDSVANTAFMSFPEGSSHHGSRHFDDTRREQLRTLIKALPQRGSSVDRFFEDHTSSTVIDRRLCDVAEAVSATRVFKDLVQPATDLAQAMQGVGLSRWPGFLKVTADRADDLSRAQAQAPTATVAPRAETKETTATTSSGKYVSQNPKSWDGVEHVGEGECVDLVKAATGAPATRYWQEGELVKGNPNIKPGTAIALFDENGHYMLHTAIYMGQDDKGIWVIDQWKWRDINTGKIKYHNPELRHLDFVNSKNPMINKGDWYHAIK